jgi:uncharacterized protein involved in exopolysaccharide biosynthesis
MRELNAAYPEDPGSSRLTLRDLVETGFRRRGLIVATFVITLSSVTAYALLREVAYESQMKILVKQERVDPLVSADERPPSGYVAGISEQELNSEMELLKSRDLLREVVVSLNLHQPQGTPGWTDGVRAWIPGWITPSPSAPSGNEERIARAVDSLGRHLDVQPAGRSNLIQVTYRSPDPERSAAVLRALSDLYLEKHLAVHRLAGTFGFFERETERHSDQLDRAQSRLIDFVRAEGLVSPGMELEITIGKLGDFEAALEDARADAAATRERISTLEAGTRSTPARITTTVRSASGRHLEDLRLTLSNLELKRVELLARFLPTSPLVREVEAQIRQTMAAIDEAESSPFMEETTDLNPAFEWATAELAKARTESAALEARQQALTDAVREYRDRSIRLDRIQLTHDALVRDVDLAQQNYLINLRKQEEARISDALDQGRMVNVVLAEPATVPYLPAGPSRALILLIGLVAAAILSGVTALFADRWDGSIRSPEELELLLELPVAAAIPMWTAAPPSGRRTLPTGLQLRPSDRVLP